MRCANRRLRTSPLALNTKTLVPFWSSKLVRVAGDGRELGAFVMRCAVVPASQFEQVDSQSALLLPAGCQSSRFWDRGVENENVQTTEVRGLKASSGATP